MFKIIYNNPEPPDEFIKCFDEDRNEIEPHTRTEIHQLPLRYWHGTTGVWVVNKEGMILCGKRSEKLNQKPDCWQSAFGGHVQASQTFEQNAVQELEEELGLKIKPEELHQVGGLNQNPEWKHLGKNYIYLFEGITSDLKFNDGEITGIKWMQLNEPWEEKLKQPKRWASVCNPESQEKIKEYLKSYV